LLEQYRQALQASEAGFRNIIEHNVDAVLVVCPNGTIAYVNPAAEELLGRSHHELLGHAFGRPVIPGEATEVDIVRSNEDVRIAEMRGVEITWKGKQAYLASLRDITGRKRAEEELRFLADASRVLAGSLDKTTTLTSVAMLAIPFLADWCVIDVLEDDRWLRPVAESHVDPARHEELADLHRRLPTTLDDASPLPQVIRLRRTFSFPGLAGTLAPQEHPRLLEQFGFRSYLCVPLLARDHTLGAITLVFAGSGRRYAAADLALAEDLARRAALAFDNARLYDESQEAIRRRDEFLAMLAHELRNPLAPILNATQVMARRGLADGVLQRARDVIERQGRHMSRLLDDLLDISRITRGHIVLRITTVDLATIVADAVQASRPLIDSRRQQLTVSLPAEPVLMQIDATRIEQVLANLLNNAAKYTEPEGQIWLTAERAGDHVVIRVRDTGIGIAPEMLAQVFEPFTQADHSLDRSQGGLGIGLTLVRRLVDMHHGTVAALSEGLSKGSEFVIRLPISRCADGSAAAGGASPFVSRRVLIVEDNADSREMLRELLQMWGHAVETAEDGPQGLRKALSWSPEVALIDIGLPGLDGYQLVEALRRENGADDMFVVALTGYGQKEDRSRALAAGFDAHLVKPVDLDELSRVLLEGPRKSFHSSPSKPPRS
jgi:signal transduction histidine kinase/CheY-like chemotaxis protein